MGQLSLDKMLFNPIVLLCFTIIIVTFYGLIIHNGKFYELCLLFILEVKSKLSIQTLPFILKSESKKSSSEKIFLILKNMSFVGFVFHFLLILALLWLFTQAHTLSCCKQYFSFQMHPQEKSNDETSEVSEPKKDVEKSKALGVLISGFRNKVQIQINNMFQFSFMQAVRYKVPFPFQKLRSPGKPENPIQRLFEAWNLEVYGTIHSPYSSKKSSGLMGQCASLLKRLKLRSKTGSRTEKNKSVRNHLERDRERHKDSKLLQWSSTIMHSGKVNGTIAHILKLSISKIKVSISDLFISKELKVARWKTVNYQNYDSAYVDHGVPKRQSDELFFLNYSLWGTKMSKPIVRQLLPLKCSMWLSYCFGRNLGRGGCAEVKLCRVTGKAIAIKKTRRLPQESFFVACEAAVMKALDHPNILQIHGATRWCSNLFLAVEYMDGGDLKNIGTDRGLGDMPEPLIATVLREVLMGLVYLHSQKYVHCDIKPQNILLSTKGEVKIGDFGVTRDMRTREDLITRGTYAFMAPKYFQSIHAPPGDIWALGITAIELHTGTVPYDTFPPSIPYDLNVTKSPPPFPKTASKHFLKFLSLAMKFDYKRRASAQDLLSLPFINQAPPTSVLIPRIEAKNRIAKSQNQQRARETSSTDRPYWLS